MDFAQWRKSRQVVHLYLCQVLWTIISLLTICQYSNINRDRKHITQVCAMLTFSQYTMAYWMITPISWLVSSCQIGTQPSSCCVCFLPVTFLCFTLLPFCLRWSLWLWRGRWWPYPGFLSAQTPAAVYLITVTVQWPARRRPTAACLSVFLQTGSLISRRNTASLLMVGSRPRLGLHGLNLQRNTRQVSH